MKTTHALLGIIITLITLTQAVQVRAQSFLTNGLVAYYPFAGNAKDASGNGNDGTVEGAVLTADRFGNANSAYYFNGTNSDILVPETLFAATNAAWTVSLWITFDNGPYADFMDVFYKSSVNGEMGIITKTNGVVVEIHTPSQGWIGASATFLTNTTLHVVGVYQKGQSLSIYINGALVNSIPVPNDNLWAQPGALRSALGSYHDDSNPYDWFRGTLSDFRVYTRALSASEVQQLYQYESAAGCAPPPAGLVSWWPGEGNANDIIGMNNGLLSNGVSFASGEVGQAFSFNGINSYVRIPDNSSLHFTNAMTIEAWVYPTSLGSYQNVLSKWDYPVANAQKSYTTSIQPDGTIGLGVCNDGSCSSGPGGGSGTVLSTNSLSVNQWTHFAATYDGSSLRIYVNGLCQNQTPYNMGLFPGTNDLLIGVALASGGQVVSPFAGLIDEPSVYSRALSAAEIQAIYNAGSAGKCWVPFITAQPQGRTAALGSTVTFVVTAGGSPPLGYQWQFNSTNIAGATASSLTLTNVQPGQAGNYLVVVSSALGVVTSSNALLAVFSPTCATPPAGLVSWWPGEGNANDIAGANNGTLVNGATFVPGEVGQAFSFDGMSSYIRIADNPSLHFTNAMTIEAWVYPTTLGRYQNVLSKWDFPVANAQKSYTTSVQPDGTIGLGVCNDGSCSQGAGGGSATVLSTNSLSVNHWTHFAASYDGSRLRIYVNGVCENQTPYNEGLFPGTNDLLIGVALAAGGQVVSPFAGLIDEPSVYSGALSAAEIQAIYNASTAGKCRVPFITSQPQGQTASAGSTVTFVATAGGPPPLSYQWQFNSTNIAGATGSSLTLTDVQPGQAGNYLVVVSDAWGSATSSNALLALLPAPCATPPAGLVAWWPGEGNANDIAGTNNGTLIGGASFVGGEVGQAFSFNGANQCVQIPYAPSLASSNYSVEAWVKPLAQVSDPISQDVIFGQSYGQCQLAARTGSMGVRIAFQFGVNPVTFYEVASTNEIPLGQFTHLAGTWDGSTLRLYINGVLNAQSTPGASPVDSGCPFSIGGFYNSCGYVGQFFNGLIDEVSYYNRALSGGEVQAIYNAGSAGKCQVPFISSQPQGQTATPGSTVTFVVTAGGSPPLSYQWQFNTTNIAGATASSLTLTNVQPSQAGNYLVVVSNALGVVTSSNAVLTVISSTCATPPAGLVSWWPAEGNANDIVGTNDGTLYNGVGFVPGMVGQAFSFNGTNSYVGVPDSPSLRLTNDLTIEFWVKRQRLSGIEVIIEKGGDWTGAECNYEVDLHDSRENYCLYLLYTGGLQGGGRIADYNWHHCAVTAQNGSTNVGIYVDGALQPISFTAGSTTVRFTPSARPLHLGAQLDPVTGWYYYSQTCVDEMSLYDRMLGSTEIQAIYDAGSAGKCKPAPTPYAATATATVVNGFIVGATITDGGWGYTNTPIVRIIGGGGSGAQAVAVVSNGVVIAVNVVDAGSGYTSTPVIVFAPPFIPQPTMGIAVMSLLSFTNLAVGTNYQLQLFSSNTWFNLGAAFTAASSTFTQYVTGTAGLNGYRLASIPVPAQAYAIAQVFNGFVVGATVTSGGSGYGSNVAVSIVGGGGTNATAVAEVSGGVVTGIAITDAGIGYTSTPSIIIAPPPANALSPTVTPAVELDLGSLSPYENYQLEFAPVLGGAWSNVGSLFIPTATTSTQFINASGSAGFFRVSYVP